MVSLSDIIQEFVGFFEEPGVYEFVLPFLLVTVLVFAILQKIKIFGDKTGHFNGIIALIIGFLLARQGTLVEFISQYLPNVSLVIIIFLGFLLLIGIFSKKDNPLSGGIVIVFIIFSVVGGIWALTQAAEGQDEIIVPLIDFELTKEDAGALLGIGLVVLILAIAFTRKKKGFEGFLDGMKNLGNTFSGNGS